MRSNVIEKRYRDARYAEVPLTPMQVLVRLSGSEKTAFLDVRGDDSPRQISWQGAVNLGELVATGVL